MSAILFDARLLRPTPTGIGQYIAALVPQLLKAAPDIHLHLLRPSQIFDGYSVEQWRGENITHHVCDWPHMSIAQHWLVPQLARQLGADLIHYPHFDAPVCMQGCPVVATIHDAKYLVHPLLFPKLSYSKRFYMRLSFGVTLRRAKKVIAVSNATADDLRRLFRVQAERISVIYEAVDSTFVRTPSDEVEEFRTRYRLPRPYILTVGELRPHKNHATVIRAYAQLANTRAHDLVIVGRDHGEGQNLNMLIADEGLAGRVHILTDVDHASLRAAYSGASLFVLASLYEGFGLPVLEAMRYGVPVVASNNSALGEITGDGGVQVPPTDEFRIAGAIELLLTDKKHYEDVRARGTAREHRFSWEQTAKKTSELYKAIIRNTV